MVMPSSEPGTNGISALGSGNADRAMSSKYRWRSFDANTEKPRAIQVIATPVDSLIRIIVVNVIRLFGCSEVNEVVKFSIWTLRDKMNCVKL